jgi:hypothetical protein
MKDEVRKKWTLLVIPGTLLNAHIYQGKRMSFPCTTVIASISARGLKRSVRVAQTVDQRV